MRVDSRLANKKKPRRIGLISDTHGLVRPQALDALQGVDLIIHAGDIGTPEVIKELEAIAPVIAIKGNNDRGAWAKRLPETTSIKAAGAILYVIHDVKELAFNPAARGFHAVISGHSHKPSITHRDGILFVNPGSAGPRRFRLPVAVGQLFVQDTQIAGRIIELAI